MDDEPPQLNQRIIDDFWARKSQEETNRWTSSEFLRFEQEQLIKLVQPGGRLLDLGCGAGDLSRSLARANMFLTGVDYQESYGAFFDAGNESFFCSQAQDFLVDKQFDLILLMGVVTHLEASVERLLYSNCRLMLEEQGTFVVKNQCSRHETFWVEGFSESLGCEYSARYPSIDDQLALLSECFEQVDVLLYPDHLNSWPDSQHVMFFASGPRPLP